jgi:hypothetical protein
VDFLRIQTGRKMTSVSYNIFMQLMNLDRLKCILLVKEPRFNEGKIAIEKLKYYKSPGIDLILAELFQADNTVCSEVLIYKFVSVCNKEELP